MPKIVKPCSNVPRNVQNYIASQSKPQQKLLNNNGRFATRFLKFTFLRILLALFVKDNLLSMNFSAE